MWEFHSPARGRSTCWAMDNRGHRGKEPSTHDPATVGLEILTAHLTSSMLADMDRGVSWVRGGQGQGSRSLGKRAGGAAAATAWEVRASQAVPASTVPSRSLSRHGEVQASEVGESWLPKHRPIDGAPQQKWPPPLSRALRMMADSGRLVLNKVG